MLPWRTLVGAPNVEADSFERSDVATQKATLWMLIGIDSLCVLGTEIAIFGVAVWICQVTHSVEGYSGVLFAGTVPGLLVDPVAGHVVDRYPRKTVMIGASVVTLLGSLIVLACALTRHLSLAPILGGAALAGIGGSFQWLALASMLPQLASASDLPKFNGFLESGKAASMMAGPVVGGAAYVFVGLNGLLAAEVVAFVIGIAVIATLKLPGKGDEEDEEDDDDLSKADLLFGFRWLYAHRPMWKVLCAGIFANFFLSIGTVLMAPYCLGLLSEKSYGISSGCYGAGMIVGGLAYGRLTDYFRNGRIFLVSIFALAVSYGAYGFARNLPSIATIDFIVALLVTLINSAMLTIWQTKVPQEASGRVLAATGMLADCSAPVAFLIGGPLGDWAVPFLLEHGGSATRWIPTVWGASKSGQIGTLFTTIGVVLFVGFLVAAMSRDVRDVEGRDSERGDADV